LDRAGEKAAALRTGPAALESVIVDVRRRVERYQPGVARKLLRFCLYIQC
jgi:hypothetical protein